MENELLEHALKYAEKGWHIFPTREKEGIPFKNKKGELETPKTKTPYLAGGFKIASNNKEQIIEWWKRFPNAGIGVACGASNLVVIDIDTKGGRNGFENYMNMNIPDGGALHGLTPSGGYHIIFSGVMRTSANVKAGVDIRSEGAYIVAPPSWIILDGEKKSYVAVDDWDRVPVNVPSILQEKLDWLKGKNKKKSPTKSFSDEEIDLDKLIPRVKNAMTSIPQWMCDDYHSWVTVGLALKTLGDAGFEIWDKWSKKSEKYDRDAVITRWEKFNPYEVKIATIFYYAKHAPKELLK